MASRGYQTSSATAVSTAANDAVRGDAANDAVRGDAVPGAPVVPHAGPEDEAPLDPAPFVVLRRREQFTTRPVVIPRVRPDRNDGQLARDCTEPATAMPETVSDEDPPEDAHARPTRPFAISPPAEARREVPLVAAPLATPLATALATPLATRRPAPRDTLTTVPARVPRPRARYGLGQAANIVVGMVIGIGIALGAFALTRPPTGHDPHRSGSVPSVIAARVPTPAPATAPDAPAVARTLVPADPGATQAAAPPVASGGGPVRPVSRVVRRRAHGPRPNFVITVPPF